jgi:chemotaxis signal transduction protein
MPESTVTGNSRLVLFKPSVGSAFGVVVDEIADIQTVELDRIEAYSRNDRDIVVTNVRHVDLIDAVCKLNDELIVVLNPRRFLPVIEQHLTARA